MYSYIVLCFNSCSCCAIDFAAVSLLITPVTTVCWQLHLQLLDCSTCKVAHDFKAKATQLQQDSVVSCYSFHQLANYLFTSHSPQQEPAGHKRTTYLFPARFPLSPAPLHTEEYKKVIVAYFLLYCLHNLFLQYWLICLAQKAFC